MGRGQFVCLKALGGRGLCGRGRAFMFSFWWVVVGEVTGAGLKKCYDSIVYIETPAVHIDCNMIYVK